MSENESDESESEPNPEHEEDPRHHEPRPRGYSRTAIIGSAVAGLAVAFLAVVWVSGNAVFYEELFRTAPTVEAGGIGADWLAGNTIPALDFLIALVHAADVIMGAFILLMVFVHWASFRRIAARMEGPAGRGEPEEVAADGGRQDGPAVDDRAGRLTGDDRGRSNGGDRS